MNRETLYRGINFQKEWVYGDLFHSYANDDIAIAYYREGSKTPTFDAIFPESFGQYTGLTDKKGVKIFEGDIIKTPRGSIGEVVFGGAAEECTHREHRRKITDVYTTYGWIFKRADGFTIAIDDEILQGEVIGNVTDTPELMK